MTKKVKRQTTYEKAMEDSIKPWLAYPGNKRQLVPILMDYIPSKASRFVDLFGGTGITGIEAYRHGKCESVIYNDLEYDMTLLLEWMYITPINDIIDAYDAVKERWFGDTDTIMLFEEDSKEYKKRTGDTRGGAHTQIWRALVDHYNTNRIILWDRPEDVDLMKILAAVEDKDIRQQLTEFVNGIPRQVPPNKQWRTEADEQKRVAGEAQEHQKRIHAEYREARAREHTTSDGTNVFAARGDFFLPAELLFIMMNTYMGQQKWGDLGRERTDRTPRAGTPRNKAQGHIKDPVSIIPFVAALKEAPIEFYSHSFTEGWIEKAHERPRTRVAEERWRRMLSNLDKTDIVFIDPPYHGSAASYNNTYTQKLEIYLFAFCQLLTERGVPWILTDNLYYENDIFKGWIADYYAYKLRPGALNLYAGKRNASDGEVIVSNFKPPTTRSILKEMLIEVPGGKTKRGLIKWSRKGERTI